MLRSTQLLSEARKNSRNEYQARTIGSKCLTRFGQVSQTKKHHAHKPMMYLCVHDSIKMKAQADTELLGETLISLKQN